MAISFDNFDVDDCVHQTCKGSYTSVFGNNFNFIPLPVPEENGLDRRVERHTSRELK